MNDTTVLAQWLYEFAQQFGPAAERIRGELNTFLTAFLLLAILWTFYRAMMQDDLSFTLLNLIMRTAMVMWLLNNWGTMLEMIRDSFVVLGLLAAGDMLTVQQALDPGMWLSQGLTLGQRLFEALTASLSTWSLGSIPLAGLYGILWLVWMCAFILMAFSIMAWQIEIVIASVVCLPLISTLMFKPIAFIGYPCLAYGINACFRMFVGTFLASMIWPFLGRIQIAQQASFKAVLLSCAAAWAVAIVLFKVNRLSAALLSGFGSLTAGTIVGGMAATAAVTGTVVAAGTAVGAGGMAGVARFSQGALAAGRGGAAAGELAAGFGRVASGAGRIASGQGRRAVTGAFDTSRYIGSDSVPMGLRR